MALQAPVKEFIFWRDFGLNKVFKHACRAWDTFKSSTRCKSMVAFYRGSCLFHYGMANLECDASESKSGPISEKAMREERGNYLANLTLYPGIFCYSPPKYEHGEVNCTKTPLGHDSKVFS